MHRWHYEKSAKAEYHEATGHSQKCFCISPMGTRERVRDCVDGIRGSKRRSSPAGLGERKEIRLDLFIAIVRGNLYLSRREFVILRNAIIIFSICLQDVFIDARRYIYIEIIRRPIKVKKYTAVLQIISAIKKTLLRHRVFLLARSNTEIRSFNITKKKKKKRAVVCKRRLYAACV